MRQKPKHGEVYYANLVKDGHVQGGLRPVIVIQNNVGNLHSDVTNVIALTSYRENKKLLPTHVVIDPSEENGLPNKSIALVEQIRSIPTDRLVGEPIGKLEDFYWLPLCAAVIEQIPLLKLARGVLDEARKQSQRSNFPYQKSAVRFTARAAV